MNNSKPLGDLEIRGAFKERLLSSKQQPQVIIDELRVHNGNAIADIVTIHKEAHCYEIKGDADKIERAIDQGKFYDLAFRKITLITTSRHIEKANRLLPLHWGIIEAKILNDRISFRNIRAARTNINFDKKIALMTLWRSELIKIAHHIESPILKKPSREDLSYLISQKLGRIQLSEYISSQLISRKLENA